MTIYLLDTNVVSDLVRFPQGLVAKAIARAGTGTISTSIIVASELRYGTAKMASSALTERVENVLARIKVWPLEEPADAIYGELRAFLERQGNLIGSHDMLIAAQCLSLDAILVSDNQREFARVPQLRVENWLR